MRLVKTVSVIFILLSSLVFAQDMKQEMTPEMKAWMEYAKPGKMHKMLAEREGKWETTMEMWMQPGAEPMVSKGTAEYKMILGGRYLQGNFKGSSMGMPFDGFSLDAYDNTKKEFVTVWLDTFGTGMTIAYSKYDEKTGKMSGMGKMIDPLVGDYIKYKTESEVISKDKVIFNMYMFGEGGKEFHSMKITYVRAKK